MRTIFNSPAALSILGNFNTVILIIQASDLVVDRILSLRGPYMKAGGSEISGTAGDVTSMLRMRQCTRAIGPRARCRGMASISGKTAVAIWGSFTGIRYTGKENIRARVARSMKGTGEVTKSTGRAWFTGLMGATTPETLSMMPRKVREPCGGQMDASISVVGKITK